MSPRERLSGRIRCRAPVGSSSRPEKGVVACQSSSFGQQGTARFVMATSVRSGSSSRVREPGGGVATPSVRSTRITCWTWLPRCGHRAARRGARRGRRSCAPRRTWMPRRVELPPSHGEVSPAGVTWVHRPSRGRPTAIRVSPRRNRSLTYRPPTDGEPDRRRLADRAIARPPPPAGPWRWEGLARPPRTQTSWSDRLHIGRTLLRFRGPLGQVLRLRCAS